MSKPNKKKYWIIVILLFALYKFLQVIASLSVGGSFGVGLGGMSGAQRLQESRTVETDAPPQVIYRIDEHRFLTLENYISCDKGGVVYYHDISRGIKTFLGFDYDRYNDRQGNDIAAYLGIIINGADNGYLAFPGTDTAQYCGSGNSTTGCPVFFFFSANYGKTFIYRIIAKEYNTPKRFSKLKVMVANDGVYLRDESEPAPVYDYYASYGIHRINKFRFDNGSLINIYDDKDKEIEILIKKELERRKIPYAGLYSSGFNIFTYAKKSIPPKTHDEANAMANELGDIALEMERRVYESKINFPELVWQSVDHSYQCNKEIKAKTITYISENGRKEVFKNEQ